MRRGKERMSFEKILNEQLGKIKLDEKEKEELKEKADKICNNLMQEIKKKKIVADVFIGGSLAKGTILKRKKYDVDIFVRFDKKYEKKDISKLLGKILEKARKIHGSRDYFQLRKGQITFEIIPVIKISKPSEMKNVTDLSYFHVSYIKKKISQNKRLTDEILLAKSFAFSQKVYGAESYIKGFSGYALELLVCYYGSFLDFVKAITKNQKKQNIILDPARHYRSRQDILTNMNEAKLASPIVFVDPTFKERNVLAALSEETFERFRQACKKFLGNPSSRFFEEKKIDEKNFNFILDATTSKQAGDIAGSKLLKFYNLLKRRLNNYFEVKKSEFEYDEGKKAKYYFKLKKKKEIIIPGPPVTALENVTRFKKKHKNSFVRKGRVYAKEKEINEGEFLNNFKRKNKNVMREMGIVELKARG